LIWGGMTAAAHGQQAAGNVVVYEPDYFAVFSPRTALDMVERVPGFTLDEGEERRGFAGAAGNVLIDGAAPAVKSEDLADILERIPAGDVVRIELIRGEGATASSAQAVRVNVVRSPSDGAGVWEASLERADDGRVSPAGQMSWSGRRGAVEYGLSAMFEDAHTPIDGEELSFDAADALDERNIEGIAEDERERRLSGELAAPFANGALALNLSLSSEDGRERHDVGSLTDLGGETVGARELEEIGELGATYARTLGPWESELAALITRRRVAEDETSEEFETGGVFDEAEREARDIDSGETIVRGSAEREFGENTHFTLGTEMALNTLDQTLELTEDDGSGPVPVDVPGANVSIEEWRGEAYATLGWQAGAWRLEASAAVETSRLTQSGDLANETELTYWKPSLQAVRPIGEDDQLRFRIYRDVGQLDFEDFAASAELSGGDVFAGNENLRPETSWRVEAAGDWRFEDGALELTLFYWRIEDALDYIPVGTPPDLFDARGNIGDAQLWAVRTAFEVPVPLVENARLRVEGTWQESEANDPLTGETRPQSEIQESFISAEFRHDLRSLDLAWGVDFERERRTPEFRFDRITDEAYVHELEVWIETTRFEGLKLRVFAANLADPRETRDRRSFDPDRNGAFDGSQRRRRDLGQVFGIELEGAF
jgi:outer membrane receptor protein involved in Fe transport